MIKIKEGVYYVRASESHGIRRCECEKGRTGVEGRRSSWTGGYEEPLLSSASAMHKLTESFFVAKETVLGVSPKLKASSICDNLIKIVWVEKL